MAGKKQTLQMPQMPQMPQISWSIGPTTPGEKVCCVTTYDLVGPCTKVFHDHPKVDFFVLGGKGTFFGPNDPQPQGAVAELGFGRTVDANPSVVPSFQVDSGFTLKVQTTVEACYLSGGIELTAMGDALKRS